MAQFSSLLLCIYRESSNKSIILFDLCDKTVPSNVYSQLFICERDVTDDFVHDNKHSDDWVYLAGKADKEEIELLSADGFGMVYYGDQYLFVPFGSFEYGEKKDVVLWNCSGRYHYLL